MVNFIGSGDRRAGGARGPAGPEGISRRGSECGAGEGPKGVPLGVGSDKREPASGPD